MSNLIVMVMLWLESPYSKKGMSTIPATNGTDMEPVRQILIPSDLGEKHTSVN